MSRQSTLGRGGGGGLDAAAAAATGGTTTKMGDLFRQRRAAAATAAVTTDTPTTTETPNDRSVPSSSKLSFLDIQHEQETQQRRHHTTAVATVATTPIHRNQRHQATNNDSGHHPRGDESSRVVGGFGGGSGSTSGSGNVRSNTEQHQHHRRIANTNNNSATRQQRGGGGSGSSSSTRNDSFPLEQGCVCSLKENYGFIQGADRNEQIFFHFSEVVSRGNVRAVDGGSSGLCLQDEVEFRIGPTLKDPDKLAAYKVQPLTPGTIQWEVEEYPEHVRVQGLVQRPPTNSSSGSGSNNRHYGNVDRSSNDEDGVIRLVLNEDDAAKESVVPGVGADGVSTTNKDVNADGPLVRFGMGDYTLPAATISTSTPEKPHRHNRGSSSPLLRAGDLVECRVVRTKPSGLLVARNITLICTERDRVQEETERRLMASAVLEHGVVTALSSESGYLKSSSRRDKIFFSYSSIDLDESDENHRLVLEEGQDMKFLVVTEEDNEGVVGGGEQGRPLRRRYSARRVQIQPRGSVVFHNVLTQRVTGTVTVVPQCVDSSHLLEQHGKIILDHPVQAKKYTEATGGLETDEWIETNEVFLSTEDSPGGRFPFRGGSSVGLWIQVGDKLLFDIVQDYSDGACRAVPTKHLTPLELESPMESNDNDKDDIVPAVRLIDLTLTGRAEGNIGALKDGYGFIQFAERSVDVHFKMFQILPDELQDDIRHNMGLANFDERGRRWELDIGMPVQFDISVQGTIPSSTSTGGSGRSRGQQQQQQQQQDLSGHERENLKAQRVLILPPNTVPQYVTLATGVRGVVKKQDATQPYVGNLELDEEALPMSMEVRHRLVAKMIRSYLEMTGVTGSTDVRPLVYHDIQSLKEEEVVIKLLEVIGNGKLVHSYTPHPTYPARLCIQKAVEGRTVNDECNPGDKQDDISQGIELDTRTADAAISPLDRKKKSDKAKPIKSIRYDRSSMSEDLRKDVPPGLDDVMQTDVLQCRRNGRVFVENLIVTERCLATTNVSETSAMGIVKEVVPARNFGFISVLDDSASMSEMLFFQMKPRTESSDNVSGTNGSKFRKGDMVKFDIGVEKNGKRTAINVVQCPKSEVRSKVDKNACLGIVLSKPSHGMAKHTPSRKPSVNPVQKSDKAGRWDLIDEDRLKSAAEDQVTEPGYVLLTHDPLGLFVERPADSVVEHEGGKTDTMHDTATPSNIHVIVKYKNGGLALNGTGSSSLGDESTHPRRGDLVSFVKSSKSGIGSMFTRDVRIVTRNAATLIRGQLKDIVLDSTELNAQAAAAVLRKGTAAFIPDSGTNDETVFALINLDELLGCNPSMIKEKEAVEGILHEGKVFGVTRVADLYLEPSKQQGGLRQNHNKERTKLNLTVKKDLGGKIMAQSMMAKGPDDTNGFVTGWTIRPSRFPDASSTNTTTSDLKVDAPEFTPIALDAIE